MKIIESDKLVFFDVDDTLVMWNFQGDWSTVTWTVDAEPWGPGQGTKTFVVNHTMVQQLIEHTTRGHKVIVWSQGGWEWAKRVVEMLKIEQYVDLVMSKPSWIYDDLQPVNWMPRAQWIGDETWLKPRT